MSDPNDLGAFLNGAWDHLRRGVVDARSAARQVVLATVSPEGLPEARTVVLRRADQALAEVEVHTDTQTAKIRSLRASPFAALHVWLPRPRLQIRLNGVVDILTGEDVLAQWHKVPPEARVSYGTEPAPGVAIDHVYDYEKPAKPERFAVLRCRLTTIDLVELGPQHRRACFAQKDGWRGTWCAP